MSRLLIAITFCAGIFIQPIHQAHAMAGVDPQTPLIILVPGFFNSLSSAPNFSRAIERTIEAHGLEVRTVDNLLSVGSIEQNSRRLEAYLLRLAARFPGRKMVLLAHSAGGLYAARALTDYPSLPVQTVVSIGTPYGGVQFIDNLVGRLPVLEPLARFVHMASLQEFETSRMAPILAGLRVPERVRWIALAAYQPPCHLGTCWRAENLSWILSFAQSLMRDASDGVVTIGSALAQGLHIGGQSQRGELTIERWSDFSIPLEHWEIAQDSQFFHVLGVENCDYIGTQQVVLFDTILNRLNFPRLAPLSRPGL